MTVDLDTVEQLERRRAVLAFDLASAEQDRDRARLASELEAVEAELDTIRRDAERAAVADLERRRRAEERAHAAAEARRTEQRRALADIARRRAQHATKIDRAVDQLTDAIAQWSALGLEAEPIAADLGLDSMRIAVGEQRTLGEWLSDRLAEVIPRRFERTLGARRRHFGDHDLDVSYRDGSTTP